MLEKMIGKWAAFVVNQRWWVIGVTITLMALAILPMKNLYYDNSSELFFVEGDPNLKNFDLLLDRFGDNESLLVGIEAREGDKTVFTYDTLQMIAKITEFLEDHEVVTKVSSLTKYQYMHSEDDVLVTDDLIEDIEELEDSPQVMNQMKEVMKNETLALGRLLTEDFRHTVIFARTLYQKGENAHEIKLVHDLQQFLKDQQFKEQGFVFHIFGAPLVEERFVTVTQEDQAILNPVMALIMILCLFVFFRSITGVLLPWVVVGGSLLLVIGIQGLLVWPFNSVVTALPPILIILGIGDSVHILTEFYHFRTNGFTPKQSAIKTIEVLWLPCFYTSFTTAVGFFSLAITKLLPIRELGVLGAFGALIAFLLSVTIIPAILSFITSLPRKTQGVVEKGWVTRFTGKLSGLNFQYRKQLAWAGVAVFAFSVFSASQISVDANWINYFKTETQIRHDLEYFDTHYNSSGGNIDFMIDSGKEGGVKEPEFLKDLLRLQEYLESLEGAGEVNSIVDYIRKMNQSMHNDDPQYFTIPETRNLIAQYLLLYENSSPEEDLTDMKTLDERYARVIFPIKNRSAVGVQQLMVQIKNELKENFPALQMELTGGLVIRNAQDTYVRDGVIKSFSLALVIIGICFFVLFRSVKYGLLALIPSILPVLFAGGVMAFLGIPLDMGTMIVGAMTIGIAVDDTIHVLNRYLQAFRSGKSVQESIHLAMTESGRAVVFTSIILTSGFSVMVLSAFMPFIYTGIFSAVIMIMALVGDLFFLPGILYLIDGKRESVPSGEMLSVEQTT